LQPFQACRIGNGHGLLRERLQQQ